MCYNFTFAHVLPFNSFAIRLVSSYPSEKLTAELKACQVKKQSLESRLASFEIYGREFEVLAEEYSRLRQEVATKSWALKEFAQ